MESSERPIDPINAPASKTLGILESYAQRPSQQASTIESSFETITKGVLQSLTAILLESGLDNAKRSRIQSRGKFISYLRRFPKETIH